MACHDFVIAIADRNEFPLAVGLSTESGGLNQGILAASILDIQTQSRVAGQNHIITGLERGFARPPRGGQAGALPVTPYREPGNADPFQPLLLVNQAGLWRILSRGGCSGR